MKRKILYLLIFLLLLTGCSWGKKAMDKPVDDGSYIYTNDLMGFALTLPKEFQYYQTERKDQGGYQDLEIFVPTSDRIYYQPIPSYALPLVVRVYTKDGWQEALKDENALKPYQKVAETRSKVYTIKFWDSRPTDWQEKWSDEMKNHILKNFKTL